MQANGHLYAQSHNLPPLLRPTIPPPNPNHSLAFLNSLALLREDLAAKIENRQRTRNAHGLAGRKNSQIPATEEAEEAESACDAQQFGNVLEICFGGRGCNGEVCCGDEGEEHDEAEEGECEEQVDAEGADEKDDAGNGPVGQLGYCHGCGAQASDAGAYMVMLWNPCDAL
jgi:hypothetical protein